MAERILLVTGSRVLADSAGAEGWARTEIVRAVEDHDPEVLVCGDAHGPDAIAKVVGKERGLPVEVWNLHGIIVRYERSGGRTRGWWPEGTPRPEPRRWPLARNAAMVHSVAMRAANGATVRVLALTAPWARTQGTAHTVARAREAGLVVPALLVCPADLGPREVRHADR